MQNTSDIRIIDLLKNTKAEAVEFHMLEHAGQKWPRPYASIVLEGQKIIGLRETFDRFDLLLKTMRDYNVDFHGSYLDLGCNMGVFVSLFDKHFSESWGIEYDPYYIKLQELLFPHLEDRLLAVNLNEVSITEIFPKKHFEVITALSMIEYIEDVVPFIASLYDKTKKLCIVEGHSMDCNDGLDKHYEHLLKQMPWKVIELPVRTDKGLNAPEEAKGRPVWACIKD